MQGKNPPFSKKSKFLDERLFAAKKGLSRSKAAAEPILHHLQTPTSRIVFT